MQGAMLQKYGATTLLLALTLLAGCVNTPKAPIAKYDKTPEQLYPGISLFYKSPSNELKNKCSEFDQKSVFHHCTINRFENTSFIQEFKNTSLFHNVSYQADDIDYKFYITTAYYNHEGADEISQAALAGATLLLVPVKISAEVTTEIAVTWKGQLLKTYTYALPFSNSASLFSPLGKGNEEFAKTLTSHFLKDAQKDQLFSTEFIAKELKASNYEKDLIYPQEIADFKFYSISHFFNPLDGVQLHYTGKVFSFDRATIFIYPIRSSEWENASKQLQQEVKNFLKDVEISVMDGTHKSADFGKPTKIRGDHPGYKVAGTITNQENETLVSSAYFFVQKDKVIKIVSHILASENLPNIDEFANAAVGNIDIPGESLFMAKLRQHYRKSEFDTN